jgi:hypothetical protein
VVIKLISLIIWQNDLTWAQRIHAVMMIRVRNYMIKTLAFFKLIFIKSFILKRFFASSICNDPLLMLIILI